MLSTLVIPLTSRYVLVFALPILNIKQTLKNLKSISFKKGAKKDCCTKFPENLPMSKRKQKMSQPQYSELRLQRNKTISENSC